MTTHKFIELEMGRRSEGLLRTETRKSVYASCTQLMVALVFLGIICIIVL